MPYGPTLANGPVQGSGRKHSLTAMTMMGVETVMAGRGSRLDDVKHAAAVDELARDAWQCCARSCEKLETLLIHKRETTKSTVVSLRDEQ